MLAPVLMPVQGVGHVGDPITLCENPVQGVRISSGSRRCSEVELYLEQPKRQDEVPAEGHACSRTDRAGAGGGDRREVEYLPREALRESAVPLEQFLSLGL